MTADAPDRPRVAEDPPTRPPVQASDGMVYVHFPYCGSKCPYCDFNSHVVAHDDVAYADAVLAELEARGAALRPPPGGLSSIYLGGGTPSLWAPSQVGRVLSALKARFGLRPGAELTLEANPESAQPERLAAFRAAGVNRFSIGCQSFDEAELAALGREHDARASQEAVRAAIATGARVSLDLIYGLPGQSTEAARRSVDRALALSPDHLSAYALTVEPDTLLERRVRLGRFRPMPDDEQARLIEAVSAHLAGAGFVRYEVSSYARQGRVSLHNTGYWQGAAYLGLGAGAHSYLPAPGLVRAERRENVRSPARYVDTALAGDVEASWTEVLDAARIAGDRLMIAFRSRFGLDVGDFVEELSGAVDPAPLEAATARLVREGLLERVGARLRPTARGWLFNDVVARAMMDAAEEATRPESSIATTGGGC